MNILLFILIFASMATHLFALEISKEELEKTFEQHCRQSISSGISIGNDNINVCNFEYINRFPEKSKKQLRQLNHKLTLLKIEISALKQRKMSTTVQNKKEITIIQKKESDLSKIEGELKFLKKELLKQQKRFNQEKAKHSSSLQNMRQKYDNVFQNITQTYQNRLDTIDKSLNGIQKLRFDMQILENRFLKVEKSIAENKSRSQENSNVISNYFENINEHFRGISILGGNSLNTNSINNFYDIGVEYEGWNPDNNSYIFGKLSLAKLQTSLKYRTLGDASELKKSSKNFRTVELGYRQLFTIQNFLNWTPYVSVSGGYISDNGWLANGAIGLEYKYKSDKFLVQFGYSFIGIEYDDTVQFNPLGNTELKRREGLGLPSISIKYLWRMF